MRHRILTLSSLFLLLFACDKDNGSTTSTTYDGITLHVDYHTHYNWFSVATTEADIRITATDTAYVGPTTLFIDRIRYLDISAFPWSTTLEIGMLNEGFHRLQLVHVTNWGDTVTLISRFFSK